MTPAHASDDGRKSPIFDIERINVDKKSTQRTKKAGEGSSNAPAIDEGRESPTADKRSKQTKAGDGSSNTRVIAESKTTTVDTSSNNFEVVEWGSQPPPRPISYHKLLVELNTIVSL